MNTNHFSHRHPLSPFKVDHQHDDQDQIICSGCELELLPGSSAYKCNKPGCDFQLHEQCYDLPREIRHSSHPQHPLALLFTPPPSFSCNACAGSGTAFIYSCLTCRFNLHVQCCALPESIKQEAHHRHPLRLVFSLPEHQQNRDTEDYSCGVCGCSFVEGCWAYFCRDCGYGNHLECAIAEGEMLKEEEVEVKEEPPQRGKSGDIGVNLVVAETKRTIPV